MRSESDGGGKRTKGRRRGRLVTRRSIDYEQEIKTRGKQEG